VSSKILKLKILKSKIPTGLKFRNPKPNRLTDLKEEDFCGGEIVITSVLSAS
jgi:hypothetical protein